MAEAKTIDNLGVDASIRWALDQKSLDPSLAKYAPIVSKEIATDINTPSTQNQLDILVHGSKQSAPSWASFLYPLGYDSQKKRLFTHQSIPSLGSDELLETQIQKIKDKVDSSREARRRKRKKEDHSWEDDREEKEELLESNALISLLESIEFFDSLIKEVNARRNQYQKG